MFNFLAQRGQDNFNYTAWKFFLSNVAQRFEIYGGYKCFEDSYNFFSFGWDIERGFEIER